MTDDQQDGGAGIAQPQERLRLMVRQLAGSEWADTPVVPEHVRDRMRTSQAWPFPEAWPSITWRELSAILSAPSPDLAALLQETVIKLDEIIIHQPFKDDSGWRVFAEPLLQQVKRELLEALLLWKRGAEKEEK